jgi:endonuclease/exonuclease/phosphatase family metal-dependent hydrolase
MDVDMRFLSLFLLVLSFEAFAGWSVSTFNIRNFDHDREAGSTNIAELKKLIKEIKSDVMAFEEVVNAPAFDGVITSTLPTYQIIRSDCGGFGRQHVALIFDHNVFDFVKKEEDLSFSGKETKCGPLRSLLLVTLKQKSTGQEMIFAVAHLKAGGDTRAMQTRWGQYKKLSGVVARNLKSKIIILGDLNTTGYSVGNDDYMKFEEFLTSSSLRTSAEAVACTNYWNGADQDPTFLPSILDHILMQDSVHAQVLSIKVGSHCQKTACRPALPQDLGVTYDSVSDHCPVQVTFK